MKNGLLIVNYNDYESTIHLIENTIDYRIIDKIVVVDNCSKDNSFKLLSELNNPKVDVIKTKSNKGYGYAINYGSKYLIKKYKKCNIIVSNSDIIIKKEEDIIKLIDNLKDKNIAVVAPIVNEHGNINRGWRLPSPKLDVLLNIVVIHRYFRKKYMFYDDDYYNNNISVVDVVSGCFFIIKSDILEKVNFFDENIFLYYEENVLSKKLKDINKLSIINNEVEIIHNHSVSIDKNFKKIKKYKELKKSQYYFQTRYNNANLLDKFFLKLTNKLTLLILYIVYFIKDII